MQDVKKAPPLKPIPEDLDADAEEHQDEPANDDLSMDDNGLLVLPSHDSTDMNTEQKNPVESSTKQLRERRDIRKPARFDNKYVYNVFY